MNATLFVTGMQRSGTTLVEKLLSSHPEISLLSQPFPKLFIEAKRAFLRRHPGPGDIYPLGDLFLESRYEPGDFARFLETFDLDDPTMLALFASMEGYSGQYTRIHRSAVEQLLSEISGQPFVPLLRLLYRRLAARPSASLVGGKEVICEEFLPALVAGGLGALVIVRDPRDVLASLNHGRGPEHGGRLKPTLLNLRNWRKSVAHVLALAGTPGFAWLRYEDLVDDPGTQLDVLTRAYGLRPFGGSPAASDLRDQEGRSWRGNSSHAVHVAVDNSSVGIFHDLLPSEVIDFAEAACWPELRWLGYRLRLESRDVPGRLREFHDPYPLERPELAGYLQAARTNEEIRRFELLREPESTATRPWFLLAGVHQRLQAAIPGA
jgi:hypothetical protein